MSSARTTVETLMYLKEVGRELSLLTVSDARCHLDSPLFSSPQGHPVSGNHGNHELTPTALPSPLDFQGLPRRKPLLSQSSLLVPTVFSPAPPG